MEYADLLGGDPQGPVRRRDDGDLGPGTLRAGRAQARRRADRAPPRRAAEGLWTLVPARLGGDEKNWLVIKKHEQAERAPAAESRETYLPMLATAASRLPARGDWLYEVKWDGYRAVARLAGNEATLSSRTGSRPGQPVPRHRPRPAPRAAHHGLRGRRRGVRARRWRAAQLRPANGRRHPGLLRVRPARARARAADRPSAGGAPPAAGGADPPGHPRGTAVDHVRGRAGAAGPGRGAGARGGGGQAPRLPLPAGPPVRRLGEGQDPDGRRLPDRGLHARHRRPRGAGRAGAGRGAGRQAGLGGNVGSGLDDASIDRLLAMLEPLRVDRPPITPVPKMPKTPARDGDLGRAAAPRPRRVHRADTRRPVAGPGVPGPADRRRAAARRPLRPGRRAEPGQGVLPRRRRHQGRRVRVLPPDRTGAGAPPRRPAVHHAPLPRRHRGQELLPEGRPRPYADWIHTFTHEGIRYAMVDDEDSLLWMVNMACIDMHPWLARHDRPERPDLVMFDLDPAEGVQLSTRWSRWRCSCARR